MIRRAAILVLVSAFFSEAVNAGVPVDGKPIIDRATDEAGLFPILSTLQTLDDVSPPNGFLETETRLKAAIAISASANDGDLALARFYAANGFEAEALHALARVDKNRITCADDVLKAKLNFSLGRYLAVVDEEASAKCDSKSEREQLASYLAAAWSKLGAYRNALASLSAASPPYLQGEFEDIAAANLEARILAGDADAAVLRAEVERLHRSVDRQLLFMLLAFREDDLRAARSHANALASALERSGASKEAHIRANVMLARLDLQEGRDTAANIGERLRRLSLKWQGGAGERELRNLEIEAESKSGDVMAALASVRQLIALAPQSDVAERVAEYAGALLPKLFEADASREARLPPAKAAAVFFDYVEFAPPGAEGDELIRSVVQNLAEIGLYSEAQKLLGHQVFNRLRGLDRATTAATLAALYLEGGKPADALLTLRRTRMAGLSSATNVERLRLEVEALTMLGDMDAALAALERDEALTGAAALRAEILWRMKEWPLASAAYVDAAGSAADSDFDQYILRAATAAVLAEDDESFNRIQIEYSPKLGDANVRELVEALGGDITKPEFLEAYKAAFRETINGI